MGNFLETINGWKTFGFNFVMALMELLPIVEPHLDAKEVLWVTIIGNFLLRLVTNSPSGLNRVADRMRPR